MIYDPRMTNLIETCAGVKNIDRKRGWRWLTVDECKMNLSKVQRVLDNYNNQVELKDGYIFGNGETEAIPDATHYLS